MGPLRSILVATDLTAASDDVLRAAGALAAVVGADLHVLHAFDFQEFPERETRRIEATFQGRVAEAERVLDEQIRRTVRPGVHVASRVVVIYIAHKAILDRAGEVDADLIVLGPHRGHPVDAILGGTADRVIRASDAPCLLVRGQFELPLRRVLVPVDLSQPARAALDVAVGWSRALRPHEKDPRPGVELVALHVAPAWAEGGMAEVERMVAEACEHVPAHAGVEVRPELRTGDSPVTEILAAAAEPGVSLLVAGTHGRGAIGRALVGSVASHIARAAACPVLLVPPNAADRRARREAERAADAAPETRALERAEVEAILARNHIGRIGYARDNRVEIYPVHYVFHDGWIYGRTSYGAKYRAMAETAYGWWPVVFQVDEVDGPFDWRSVLVRGGFYLIERDEPDGAWDRAIAILRRLMPGAFSEDDPVPHRSVLFRIAVQETSGRESTASPRGSAG